MFLLYTLFIVLPAFYTLYIVCSLYLTPQQMQQQNPQKVEASKVPEYIKKAAKKAAEFNSNFNRERMEERRAYFDLQTHVSTELIYFSFRYEMNTWLCAEMYSECHSVYTTVVSLERCELDACLDVGYYRRCQLRAGYAQNNMCIRL